MKIINGLFTPENAVRTIRRLVNDGFSYDDLSMMSSVAEIPEYLDLEGEPEKSAGSGAAVGAVAGGTIGALSSFAASTIPGFENMFVSGLMATTVGGVVGGYLGSLYSVRAETQTEIDVHEALEEGDILIVVKTASNDQAKTAESIMQHYEGRDVEIHHVSAEEIERHTAAQK